MFGDRATVATAQFAGGARNADYIATSSDVVVVLDGATAFEPVDLDPADYAEQLGIHIIGELDRRPTAPIADAVSRAISTVVNANDLKPGRSPSSTVSVLRVRDVVAEMYVLGDSPIYYGSTDWFRRVEDKRLDAVAKPERRAYVEALRNGGGYSETHRKLLVDLQREQRRSQNRLGGYWIAEAVPEAAGHGVRIAVPVTEIGWAVMATDGASDLLACETSDTWRRIAASSSDDLFQLLASLHDWERNVDPGGRLLPRAKAHDDKSVVAVAFKHAMTS